MSKVFIGIILVLGLGLYFLWSENASYTINQAFEIRNQEQLATIETMQNDFKVQSEGLLACNQKTKKYKPK